MTARALFLCAAAAAALTAASPASAQWLGGAFSSGVGDQSGTDLWGNPWQYSAVQTLAYSGVFKGLVDGVYYHADYFEVGLNPTLDYVWGTLTGTVASIAWQPDHDSYNVYFYAPAGVLANPGDLFSFSITYTSPALSHAGTTAVWDPVVPELSTWAMMGIGFAGLAFAGLRSRRGSISAEFSA